MHEEGRAAAQGRQGRGKAVGNRCSLRVIRPDPDPDEIANEPATETVVVSLAGREEWLNDG